MLLATATVAIFFTRRRWARYTLLAMVVLLAGYALLLGFFSWSSYERTVARGDEKFFCALDCHIGYSVVTVERARAIGDVKASGEFVVVTVRSHFDERTIAPWRGNGALAPDPPMLVLVDASGREYRVSPGGQRAWEKANASPHLLTDPLRPGESYETTWVFDVPPSAQPLRLFAGWHGFPSYLLIGDEDSPRHAKTYFAL